MKNSNKIKHQNNSIQALSDLLFNLKDWFIYLALFSYPFSILLNNIFFGLAFLIILFLNIKGRVKYKIDIRDWIFVLLPLIYIHVVLFTMLYEGNANFIYIEKYFSFLFFPVVFLLYSRISSISVLIKRINYVIIASSFSLATICLVAHIYKFILNDISFKLFTNWEYTNMNFTAPVGLHTTYAGLWVLLGLILIFELNRRQSKFRKVVLILPVIFFIAFILLSSSRVIIGCTIIYFLSKYIILIIELVKQKKYLKITVSLILILICTLALAQNISVVKWRFLELSYNLFEQDYSKISYGGLKIRLIIWECSISEILKSPFLGGYIGEVGNRLNNCYDDFNFVYGQSQGYGAHNQYLSMALNFGLFGLFVLIFLLVKTFLIYLRLHKQYSFIILIFAVCFLVESMLSVQKGIVLWTFFTSIALGLNMQNKKL